MVNPSDRLGEQARDALGRMKTPDADGLTRRFARPGEDSGNDAIQESIGKTSKESIVRRGPAGEGRFFFFLFGFFFNLNSSNRYRSLSVASHSGLGLVQAACVLQSIIADFRFCGPVWLILVQCFVNIAAATIVTTASIAIAKTTTSRTVPP